MLTFSNELKNSYKIPALIFAAITVIYLAGIVYPSLDLSLLTRVAIVVAPVAVSVSCFLISKNYNHSKVFGKSYFLLGLGHLVTFSGELVFFHYVDSLHFLEYTPVGDVLIFSGYPFTMAHIIINVRYFVEKLENFQKIMLVIIPGIILLGYSAVLMGSSFEDPGDFYYYLSFVTASSIVLGLATVAFTLFRQTALFTAWFVLLIGITIGTIGDVLYNYASTLGVYSFGDFSNVLWIASPLIMVYALYRHQKSI
ncbi:MAG: hypothetical protein OEL81_03170 [Nitrosopumilus sp.]|nr:hypothetical protein [Nitrosopumilus sp.]MDH3488256.1 hypothetical protein [Nitrosopumilus sp.]